MEQSDLLAIVVDALEQLGIGYLATGSQASIFFGEPRFTNDIDIVVQLRLEHVSSFCAAFPKGKFDLSDQAASDAIVNRTQFNIIHPTSGLKVDLIVAKNDSFDENRFRRVVLADIGTRRNVCFAS